MPLPHFDLPAFQVLTRQLLERAGGELRQASAWLAGPQGNTHPLLARALLSLEDGLIDSADAAARLRPLLEASPLPLPPPLIVPPSTGRRVPAEMALRLIAAALHHPGGPPLRSASTPGALERRIQSDPQGDVLLEAVKASSGPLAVFVAHGAELPALLERLEPVLGDAVGLAPSRPVSLGTHLDLSAALSASRPHDLTRLAQLGGRDLLILGCERLLTATLEPLLGLLEDYAALTGAAVQLLSTLDWPLPGVPSAPTEPAAHPHPEVRFTQSSTEALITRLERTSGRVAVVLPTRKSALSVASRLPDATLLTRSLCSAHRGDLIKALPRHGDLTVILTPGMLSDALGHFDTVLSVLAPLEQLSLALTHTTRLEVLDMPEVPSPQGWRTALSLTRAALERFEHPADPSVQRTYAQALFALSQTDARAAVAERTLLNFAALSARLAPRDPAVAVFVPYDGEAKKLIEWMRAHGGAYPDRLLRFATRLTQRAWTSALEHGQGEAVGAVGVWTAPYDARYGIGRA